MSTDAPIVITRLERHDDGYLVARVSRNGTARVFDDSRGSWSRPLNRRFPEDRDTPTRTARREALPDVAAALQRKARRLGLVPRGSR